MTNAVGNTSTHQQKKGHLTIALNFNRLPGGHRWHPGKRPKHSMQKEGGEGSVPQFTFLNTGSIIGRDDM